MQKSKFHNIVSAAMLAWATYSLISGLRGLAVGTSILSLQYTYIAHSVFILIAFFLLNKKRPINLFGDNLLRCQKIANVVLLENTIIQFTKIAYIVSSLIFNENNVSAIYLIGITINLVFITAMFFVVGKTKLFLDSKQFFVNTFNCLAILVYTKTVIVINILLFSAPGEEDIKQLFAQNFLIPFIPAIVFAVIQIPINLFTPLIKQAEEKKAKEEAKILSVQAVEPSKDTENHQDTSNPTPKAKSEKAADPMPFAQYSQNNTNDTEDKTIKPGPSPIN